MDAICWVLFGDYFLHLVPFVHRRRTRHGEPFFAHGFFHFFFRKNINTQYREKKNTPLSATLRTVVRTDSRLNGSCLSRNFVSNSGRIKVSAIFRTNGCFAHSKNASLPEHVLIRLNNIRRMRGYSTLSFLPVDVYVFNKSFSCLVRHCPCPLIAYPAVRSPPSTEHP
jgi:hypothetical protein